MLKLLQLPLGDDATGKQDFIDIQQTFSFC